MSLIPWKPFGDIDKFFDEEFDWHPIIPFRGFKEPAMDVYETDKDVVAELSLPGYDPEKVDVEVKDNVLYVKGTMEREEEEKGKDYYRKEIRKGAFQRAVTLPSEVKDDEANASYEDGVLKVVIPKKEAVTEKPGKKVKVKRKKD